MLNWRRKRLFGYFVHENVDGKKPGVSNVIVYVVGHIYVGPNIYAFITQKLRPKAERAKSKGIFM